MIRAGGLLLAFATVVAHAHAGELPTAARSALRKAVEYFDGHVAVNGTYLWQYSPDLSRREGEGKATATQGWVQPPGTPAVGLALLRAYEATTDRYHLDAARRVAHGLLQGQLKSGGWTYMIEFGPSARNRFLYRQSSGRPAKNARNVTTLDDGTTQTALRFLAKFDETVKGADTNVHEALDYAIEKLLQAQYPNGAWPQGFDGTFDPSQLRVLKASHPPAWPREWPGAREYWLRYTLNDGALTTLIEVLLEIENPRCRTAAEKAGDFLLLAQMPEPQPAWAQQYDFDMHPCWARKFEPPAISGGESQAVLRALMLLYRQTRQGKYLESIPKALDYLRRSRLPNGKLARFYELRSNRPLYLTRNYELTYEDSDLPTHYAFKVEDNTDSIRREYERLKNDSNPTAQKTQSNLEPEVRRIISTQDSQGRWIESGRLRHYSGNEAGTNVIRTATFIRNVDLLSRYLSDGEDRP